MITPVDQETVDRWWWCRYVTQSQRGDGDIQGEGQAEGGAEGGGSGRGSQTHDITSLGNLDDHMACSPRHCVHGTVSLRGRAR